MARVSRVALAAGLAISVSTAVGAADYTWPQSPESPGQKLMAQIEGVHIGSGCATFYAYAQDQVTGKVSDMDLFGVAYADQPANPAGPLKFTDDYKGAMRLAADIIINTYNSNQLRAALGLPVQMIYFKVPTPQVTLNCLPPGVPFYAPVPAIVNVELGEAYK